MNKKHVIVWLFLCCITVVAVFLSRNNRPFAWIDHLNDATHEWLLRIFHWPSFEEDNLTTLLFFLAWKSYQVESSIAVTWQMSSRAMSTITQSSNEWWTFWMKLASIYTYHDAQYEWAHSWYIDFSILQYSGRTLTWALDIAFTLMGFTWQQFITPTTLQLNQWPQNVTELTMLSLYFRKYLNTVIRTKFRVKEPFSSIQSFLDTITRLRRIDGKWWDSVTFYGAWPHADITWFLWPGWKLYVTWYLYDQIGVVIEETHIDGVYDLSISNIGMLTGATFRWVVTISSSKKWMSLLIEWVTELNWWTRLTVSTQTDISQPSMPKKKREIPPLRIDYETVFGTASSESISWDSLVDLIQ